MVPQFPGKVKASIIIPTIDDAAFNFNELINVNK